MMKVMARKTGFTLIELLVVIAIIGILAAILFPVIGSALRKAKTVQCVGNLKQQMTAMMIYIDGNRTRLPGTGSPTKNGKWSSPNESTYGGATAGTQSLDGGRPLNRELKDVEVYECPLDKGGSGAGTSAFDSKGTSYVYAWVGANGVETVKDPKSSANGKGKLIADSTLAFATKKIILYDYSFKSTGGGTISNTDAWHHPKKRGGVAGYLDGHAAFTEAEYSSAPTNDTQREDRLYY